MQSSKTMPEAMIFDLDGVITDTAKYHFLAWKRLSDELGFSFTEQDNERLKGVSRIGSFEIILEINGASDRYSEAEKEALADRKNTYYREFVETITKQDILPGVMALLNKAKKAGIPCAVASISKNAPRILERLGIGDCFDYIADAAAVKKPKPDPEIFLNCAQALHALPQNCVAFEDAQAGIEAIYAANMVSVGIGVAVTTIPPDLALRNTAELDFDAIVDFYAARQNKGREENSGR